MNANDTRKSRRATAKSGRQSAEKTRRPKDLRKRPVPHFFDQMWASQPGIGGFRFSAKGDDFEVEWVTCDGGAARPAKIVSFKKLCTLKKHACDREELGLLIAELYSHHAGRVLQSIPGPNEAMRESNYFEKIAAEWRHWAIVPAGHMDLPHASGPRKRPRQTVAR